MSKKKSTKNLENNKKSEKLTQIKANQYQIYGIFDFNKNKLIYVGLDLEAVEFEFDLEGYDEHYEVITFDVVLI